MKIKRGVLLHSKKLFSSASVLNCLFKGTSTFFFKGTTTNGASFISSCNKNVKNILWCGRGLSGLGNENYKYLTQNEKFVLLYRK